MLLLGCTIIAVPNLLLVLFGLPPTSEVWFRVVGLLVVILGYYYLQAARFELVSFYRATVTARVFVLLGFAAFVLLGFVKPVLILFGVIDCIGAAWTFLGLRAPAQRT